MFKVTVFLVAAGAVLASPALAGDCRAKAKKAAIALYTINNPQTKNFAVTSHLLADPEPSESGSLYRWEVRFYVNGAMSSVPYEIDALDDGACTVFLYAMIGAG